MLVRDAWIAMAVLAAACGSKPEWVAKNVPTTPLKQAPAVPPAKANPALLSELSVLATASVPSPAILKSWSDGIERGEHTLADYVDFLIEQPAFGQIVAPNILLRETLFRPPTHVTRSGYYMLKNKPAKEGAAPIAYYLTAPCNESQAVEVEPWWALGTKIKVCSAAYRPEVWETKRGAEVATCDSIEGSPTFNHKSRCGCGPNLIRCFVDGALENTSRRESLDELRETIAYVSEHDLPLQTLYSGTYTFRRRNAEATYRWHQVEAERRPDAAALLRDLSSWPATGKWAERLELAPGQHAGLLTALGNVWANGDSRQRQWRLFDMLWCTGVASIGASTEDLLSLKVHSFQMRNQGWQELARRPICTSCHARMDYGMQFFNAYPSPVSFANHFVPSKQSDKTGPLFLHDKDDPRGEAVLTPAGFATLAMSQPEFPSCIASKFVENIFGVDTDATDIDAVEKEVFAGQTVTIKAVAKAALLRFAMRRRLVGATPVPAVAAVPKDPVTPVTPVASVLHSRLKELCGDCHTDGATIPNLESDDLSRPLLLHSLDFVASKKMPKDQPLPVEDRLALIRLLIDQLWTNESQRTEVYEWLAGPLQLPATHRWPTLHHAIDTLAGIPVGKPWNAVENLTSGEETAFTPNTGLMTTLEAIRACKQAGNTGKTLEACVERATPTSLIVPK